MGDAVSRWCVLRTGGQRTVRLAQQLAAAGFEAWTPIATVRSLKPGKKPGVRELPIMPTFVFARERHVIELLHASTDPASRLPSFSMLRRVDRVPLVGDRDIAALRAEEERATEAFNAVLEGEEREERRKARAALMRTENAKRRALRSQPLAYGLGSWIEVDDMPALAGLSGQIIEERGRAALVCFGGVLEMEIEAWRMLPHHVDGRSTGAA